MQFLLLSIFFNTILGVIFKLYSKFKIDVFQAIVFNYFTCVLAAWIDLGHFPLQTSSFEQPWFRWAIILGFLFVSGFNMVAQTVRYFGITTGAIMQKMSLGFTVIFSFWALGELMNSLKWAGVVAAILAIIFTNYPKKKTEKNSVKMGYKVAFPILALVFSVLIEVVFLIVEKRLAIKSADPIFTGTLFGTAAIIGVVGLILLLIRRKTNFQRKNLIAGVALGIPNYLAIHYMLKALGSELEASVFFTLNNVGIIVFAAVLSVVLFSERFSKPQYFGLALSVLAILLIYFGA